MSARIEHYCPARPHLRGPAGTYRHLGSSPPDPGLPLSSTGVPTFTANPPADLRVN